MTTTVNGRPGLDVYVLNAADIGSGTTPGGTTALPSAGGATDSAGTVFNPDDCAHTFTYDGTGNLLTDTAVLAGVTRVKTFTWTSGNLTAESRWVVQ